MEGKGWHVWVSGGGTSTKTDYCFNAPKSARRWATKNIGGVWMVKECKPAEQGGNCIEPPTRKYLRHQDCNFCCSCTPRKGG